MRAALGAALIAASCGARAGAPTADAGAADGGPGCASCVDGRLVLRAGWQLRSSAEVRGGGREISTPGYDARGWTAVTVPTTVLAALVAAGAYPDPYVGDNLTRISPAPFATSWWYRTEVVLPADFAGGATWLELDGINFRADVWLNGTRVAGSDEVAGTFTAHEHEVGALARPGQVNALAIEVFPPDLERDLALTWLDWNPAPPDRDMGIWRDVALRRSGPVAVRDAHVLTDLDPALDSARLTVKADAVNTTGRALHAVLRAQVEQAVAAKDVDLAPRETRPVAFGPLVLSRPRLWWPARMGQQEMYELRASAEVDGRESDARVSRFGVRALASEIGADGARRFRVNGEPVLIRGAGWAPDMMLRASPERLDAELRYALDLGLNALRLEGKLETDDFYARADELGLLVLAGWMCCDRWQAWGDWTPADHRIAMASMDTQARRLRDHPSVIAFLIGSDQAPPPDVERDFLDVLRRDDWPDPVLASASSADTPALGATGVKMTGPYDWVAPSYWLEDARAGGAFGFNTETGPRPAIPELESLRAMLSPAELVDLWSRPDAKHLHAGTAGTQFDDLAIFNAALAARHGAPTSLEDYVRKAQLMSYEAERALFEAYARNQAPGVIHWMLNNAWPSLIWHLYGHDLAPAGGYYGARKANEPLHIQYSYDDRSVVVVNRQRQPEVGLLATVGVYDLDGTMRFARDATVDLAGDGAGDGVARVLTVPALDGLSPTYFVRLALSRAGSPVSTNFYWLSTRAEIVDFAGADWYHAPTAQYADFTALSGMPAATLRASVTPEADSDDAVTRVALENPSPSIAFFVRLLLTRGPGGEPVTPVLWEDNYVSLLPGERREIAARCRAADLRGTAAAVVISGWNVAPMSP